MNENNKCIYVSLDSLLDTRLGTLLKINPEFAFNVTNKSDYYTREEDLFSTVQGGTLDKKILKQVMNEYKDEVITLSLRTKMHLFIFELFNKLLIKAIDGPVVASVELVINVYPYTFKEAQIDLLIKSVSSCLNNQFNISVVNISTDKLTCAYIHDHYKAMIMYDYTSWLDIHSESIKTRQLKDIVLYIPRMHFVRHLTDEEMLVFKEKNTDQFEFLTMLMNGFIDVNILPIELYCADTPINPLNK